MNLRTALFALGAGLLFSAPAQAQDEAPSTQTLLPESVNLEIIDGSTVPEDCQFPESITDTTRFETACVTMPRFAGAEIAARYIGQLGQQGWHQGVFISGGMTAVRTDENNCERVLNIFPSDFPAGERNSPTVVIWFALDRQPRCGDGAQ